MFSKYFFLVVFFLLTFVFSINYAVDPLWYRNTDTVLSQNLASNERYMKSIHYARNSDQYDCVIFGSSRSSLLNEKEIKPFRCFNFSFSNGHVKEFLEIANYISASGAKIKLMIVSIDEVSFLREFDNPGKELPSFLDNFSRPNIIEHYLTWDVLKTSLKTILGRHNLPRYYLRTTKSNFSAGVLLNVTPYIPETTVGYSGSFYELGQQNVHLYTKLFSMFPEAHKIPLVLPMHTEELSKLKANSNFSEFANGLAQIPFRTNTKLLDFLEHPDLSTSKLYTYDGFHYFPEALSVVTETINNELRDANIVN